MTDPFANCRCTDCGWVHYRELPCPLKPPRNLLPLQRRGFYLHKIEARSA